LNSNVDEANKNSKLVVTFLSAIIFELHKRCDPITSIKQAKITCFDFKIRATNFRSNAQGVI
jgi:hypothetical protein